NSADPNFPFLTDAADDIASGDLPGGINVLDDIWIGKDEGRAMLQIIHDVAPGANLAFHTANGGTAKYAQGIAELSNAGADVIVDDIRLFDEPMFQDGLIAQAVDSVVADGVSYFASAGNYGRLSYENAFSPSGQFLPNVNGELHDFDPSSRVDTLQQITIPANTGFTASFQWDSPLFSVSGGSGSPNNLNIYLFDITTAKAVRT
ncbi:MAG: peptidase S8, partial [Cyanobacteria bacterium J06592_8]